MRKHLSVGERSVWSESLPKGEVDWTEVNMQA